MRKKSATPVATSLKRKWHAWKPALTAALLPLLAQLVWLLSNTQLPVYDASEPLLHSLQVYQNTVSLHWGEALRQLFVVRDWRPVSFFLLEVPFQFLSGGSLMFTARAVTLLGTLVTCLYIFQLLRLLLDMRQAVLGTTLLGLLPLVQWPGTYFAFTEDAFLPMVLATVYHLIRSRSLREPRHSFYFTLAAAAAFTLRPVEALIHLSGVFILFLWVARSRRTISRAQLYTIITMALVSASLLVIAGWAAGMPTSHSPIFTDADRGHLFTLLGVGIIVATFLLLACIAGRWLHKNRHRFTLRPPYAVPAFATIYAVILLWFIGYVPMLVEWVYMTSFGNLAALVTPPPFLLVLRIYAQSMGLIAFTSILLVGAGSFVFCLRRTTQRELLHHPLLYLATLIPLPLLVALVSIQYFPRKVSIALPALALLMLVPLLIRGRWQATRNAFVAFLILIQFSGLVWIGLGHERAGWLDTFMASEKAMPAPVTIHPNPHDTVSDFLVKNAKLHGFKYILLPIRPNEDILIDPFLTHTIMAQRMPEVGVGFPYINVFDEQTLSTVFGAERGADAFLMISEGPSEMLQSHEAMMRFQTDTAKAIIPNSKLTYTLQALYAGNKLGIINASKVDCVMIDPTGYQACLFAIHRPKSAH